jgi:hypothetical protein
MLYPDAQVDQSGKAILACMLEDRSARAAESTATRFVFAVKDAPT